MHSIILESRLWNHITINYYNIIKHFIFIRDEDKSCIINQSYNSKPEWKIIKQIFISTPHKKYHDH